MTIKYMEMSILHFNYIEIIGFSFGFYLALGLAKGTKSVKKHDDSLFFFIYYIA